MSSILNATTTSGLVTSADNSGSLELQANGTTKATVSSSGLAIGQYNPSTSLITSGTAVASTSGTSIDFTSIPSWVKRITIMFQDVSTSGTAAPMIQVGTGGTPTTSGYNISYSQLLATPAQNTSSSTTSGIVIYSNIASYAFSGFITACNINGNSWVFNGIVGNKTTTSQTSLSAGSISLAGVLNIARITTVGGTDTFDAGSINILYE